MVIDPHFAHFTQHESGQINASIETSKQREREIANSNDKPFLFTNDFERLSIDACHFFLGPWTWTLNEPSSKKSAQILS